MRDLPILIGPTRFVICVREAVRVAILTGVIGAVAIFLWRA